MAKLRASRKIWIARIREMRIVKAESGLSFRQIAEDVGYAPHRLSHVMGGHQITTPEIAKDLAEYFNRDIKELFICIDLENPDDYLKATAA